MEALPEAKVTEFDPDDYRLIYDRVRELRAHLIRLSPAISKPLGEESARKDLLISYKNISRPTAVITEDQIDAANTWISSTENFMTRVLRKYEQSDAVALESEPIDSLEESPAYESSWGYPWTTKKSKKKVDDNNTKYLKWLAIAGAAGAVGYFGYQFIKSEE